MTMKEFHSELLRLIKAAMESNLSLEDIRFDIADTLEEIGTQPE